MRLDAVEIADRIGLELSFGDGLIADFRQLRDAMTLQATMQRRPCEMRDRRLQGVKAIVQREERMPAEGDDDRLVLNRQNGWKSKPCLR